jgi:N6-adenosine-specific RNA methylase IME4
VIAATKKFRAIVADPPWPMRWSGGASNRRNGRGEVHRNLASSHKVLPYSTMSIDAIAALNVAAVADDDAALLLWAPDRFEIDGAATRVCRAWGFEPQRFVVWRKAGFGQGTFPRPQHELALYARRGAPKARTRNVGSVHSWKLVYEQRGRVASRRHSAKPPDFLAMVETVFVGPYLEMFARDPRIGWSSYGNEVCADAAVAAALEGRA